MFGVRGVVCRVLVFRVRFSRKRLRPDTKDLCWIQAPPMYRTLADGVAILPLHYSKLLAAGGTAP